MTLTLMLASLFLVSSSEPEVTILDNGLTVITQELHYAPVVATAVSYRVGSRNERDGARGMSHFVEHMMFKGTEDMPKARFWQIVQRDGGMANAWTSNDMTVYFLVLPSHLLDDALAIESDRMTGCVFDSAEVVAERNVILEERRMGSVDDPDGILWEALALEAYRTHPYRHPIVGYEEDISVFDRDAAQSYYRAFYCPSNAVLSIVGDIDTEDALARVRAFFGDIPAGGTPHVPVPMEPAQVEPRRVELTAPSAVSRVAVAFHIPGGANPDSPLLGMIATYLSDGRSSMLEQDLVQSGIAMSAGAWCEAGIDPGLFVISATLMPGVSPSDAEAAILAEIDTLRTIPLAEEEISSLRTRARAAQVLDSSSPLGLALQYSSDRTAYGNHMMSRDNLSRIERATADDLLGIAGRYLDPRAATFAVMTPEGEAQFSPPRQRQDAPVDMQEPSSIDYEGLDIPEALLEAPGTSVSDGAVHMVLPNGLAVWVKEDRTFPIVGISFAVPMSDFRCPARLTGLDAVTVSAMLHGTPELDYEAFNARLESLGYGIDFHPSDLYSSGTMTVLAEDLPVALQTVSDLLLRPAFRVDDVATVIEEEIAGVGRRSESIFAAGSDELSRMMLADPSQARIPTVETLSAITRQDVVDFWSLCCRPGGSAIVVVGDVDADSVFASIEALFGAWSDPDLPLPGVELPEFSAARGDTAVVPMPGKSQSAVFIGRPAPGYDNPQYASFNLMNRILGSGIGSRLGHFVRDDQGLAYDVGSWVETYEDRGVFTAYLSTKADFAPGAAASVIGECGRMASEEVDPIELRLAKSCAVGRAALSGMSYRSQADNLVSCYMTGLPPDWDRISLEAALQVDARELMDAAASFFDGNWFVSFAGGIGEDLQPLDTD